jgi:hypothetical protein
MIEAKINNGIITAISATRPNAELSLRVLTHELLVTTYGSGRTSSLKTNKKPWA